VNPDDYIVKQEFYESKDGTRIPLFIVHKKGLELDSSNPTLLYGYGGFNISLTPSFAISRMPLLKSGCVFAMANLRGGGEYGEEWHRAGMLQNKHNVFDDFIAAAEFLVSEKYTRPEKLAIHGGSNGGLLVGAVINQRPDLFQVAMPAVGVMDMLRYHTFTIGWAWKSEYGSSEDEEHFENLYSYSPLHNIEDDVEYPVVLVTTADHDDRVFPGHSFKYIAALQEKKGGDNPALIRIETKVGHGAGTATSKTISLYTDLWSFMLYNLGEKPDFQ
jgi:prolyl oligopeptidase